MQGVKVVKFKELYLLMQIKEINKKYHVRVLDIFQTKTEANHKKKFYDFINAHTKKELKKMLKERGEKNA